MDAVNLQSYLEAKFREWRPAPPVVESRTKHGVTLTWEQDGTSFDFMKEHLLYRIEIKERCPPWRVIYSGQRTRATLPLEPRWPQRLRLRAALRPGAPLRPAAAARLGGPRRVVRALGAPGDDDEEEVAGTEAAELSALVSRWVEVWACGADPGSSVPVFSMAVRCGRERQIQQMLEVRPELADALDAAAGLTPLAAAVHAGSAASVRALLAAGADVDRASSAGQTPLHVAAFLGLELIVRLLLEHGADVQVRDGTGHSSAELAAAGAGAGAAGVLRLLAARAAQDSHDGD